MGMGGQRHAPAALPPGKMRHPFYRRLGELQGWSGRMRKISPPPGFDPWTVQPVASGYTDWVMPTPVYHIPCINYLCKISTFSVPCVPTDNCNRLTKHTHTHTHTHTYIYIYIFTALLLHVSVCYTQSSGRVTCICAPNHMFVARLISMVTGVIQYKTHTIFYNVMYSDWNDIL